MITNRTLRSALFALMLVPTLWVAATTAAPPAGYYDTVDTTTPATLRATLHDVIDGHVKIPYTSSSTDTWNVLNLADEDPYNAGRILDVYQNRTFTKHTGGNNDYNREHTWPKSYGFPDDGSSNKPYTDCHHLFLCDIGYNGDRSNLIYDDCVSGCATRATDFYDGQSGVNRFSSVWQTWDGRKGDVARAMFYMDVRYAGDGGGEPDLILTDDAGLIAASATGGNEPVAYMGRLSTLLEWHYADPVDDKERDRNDAINIYQGNRNPFIDHPEWVAAIFDEGTAVDHAPAPAAITSIHPNPFNPSTTVEMMLPRAGRVRVEIFDLDGALVRTLVDDVREAGLLAVEWDGRDEQGATASSGAYHCRLVGDGVVDIRSMLLLK